MGFVTGASAALVLSPAAISRRLLAIVGKSSAALGISLSCHFKCLRFKGAEAKTLEPGNPAWAMKTCDGSKKIASRTERSRPSGNHSAEARKLSFRGALAIGNAAASCSCQIPRLDQLVNRAPSFKQFRKEGVNKILWLRLFLLLRCNPNSFNHLEGEQRCSVALHSRTSTTS